MLWIVKSVCLIGLAVAMHLWSCEWAPKRALQESYLGGYKAIDVMKADQQVRDLLADPNAKALFESSDRGSMTLEGDEVTITRNVGLIQMVMGELSPYQPLIQIGESSRRALYPRHGWDRDVARWFGLILPSMMVLGAVFVPLTRPRLLKT